MSTATRTQLRNLLANEVAPAFAVGVPIEQQRQTLDGMGAGTELADGIVVEQRPLAGMRTDRLVGPGCSTDHVLLHLHGGGYVMGSCVSHRALASRLVAFCGVQAVLPEYRLAPEHPFPAALEDAVAAYRALLDEGFAADKIILAGDSAGGGLALTTLLALRDEGVPLPAAAVLISPLTDMTFSGESMQTRAKLDPWLSPELMGPTTKPYIGDVDPRDPRLSPLFADLRGLPPLLLHVGDHEILLSDSSRLAERAQAAGVDVELRVWPEVWHVWHFFAPMLDEANEALGQIGAFVQARLPQATGPARAGSVSAASEPSV